MYEYDILIVGGGPVGASLALALAKHPLKIGVIEEKAEMPSDQRAIALALSTQKILSTLGLWEKIEAFANPIQQIHVSDRGRLGMSRFNAAEQALAAYGYVVTSNRLLQIFRDALLENKTHIHYLCPAQVQALNMTSSGQNEVHISGSQTLRCKLLVGADGNQSMVRQLLNIPTITHDYQQKALVTTLDLTRGHQNIAYERFSQMGTLALLPLGNQRSALIWTTTEKHADILLQMSDVDFLNQIQEHFGYRLGRFVKVDKRLCFPLHLIRAQKIIAPGVVLIGNAAHSLHPIAAQGFNLGLRDVAFLAEIIVEAMAHHEDLHSFNLLKTYQDWRKQDHRQTLRFTHNIVKIFSQRLAPVILARDLGLLSLNMLPLLKYQLTKQGMGLVGRLPKLACGIPLEL